MVFDWNVIENIPRVCFDITTRLPSDMLSISHYRGSCHHIILCNFCACVLLNLGNKKRREGGFEAAVEAAEKDEKKVEAMKKYPGLCLPDNPERAIQLLQPDSKDVKAAKEALNEVHVIKVHVLLSSRVQLAQRLLC